MSEPTPRPAIASSPTSVLLFADALSTTTLCAVQAWHRALADLHRPYEIFLIQGTRPDIPGDNASHEAQPTRVFTYERSHGFRDAINDAIRAAQYPLLAFCPADNQYSPSELERLLKSMDQVDLVVGYRAGFQTPPWRVVLDIVLGLFSRVIIGLPLEPRRSWLGSAGWGRRWIARWIFGVRVTDPECPFRLVRREVFQRLPIQSGGPFMPVEMLAKANHLSCYLAEELVSWTPPTTPANDAISFAEDAKLVFRDPVFGVIRRAELRTESGDFAV